MNIVYLDIISSMYPIFSLLLKDEDININHFVNVTYVNAAIDKSSMDSYESVKRIFKDRGMFLNGADIVFGEYDVDWNTIEPIDKNTLSQMHSCEIVILKMMGRVEKFDGTWSYEKRKGIYLKHVRFWKHILVNKKINFFFYPNIPHDDGYGYVIYSLCKLFDIPVLFLHQTIPEFLYFINDLDDFFPELRVTYQNFLKLDNKSIKLEPNSRGERLFLFQTSKINKPTPFYMKRMPITIKERFKSLKNKFIYRLKRLSSSHNKFCQLQRYPSWFYLLIGRKVLGVKNITLRLFYERCCEKPDLDTTYVYFPLHLQPELSTCPLAWDYVDQSLILSLVSRCLPDNVKIYVKENPKQDRFYRSKSFYKKLMGTKNVILISRKFDTYTLINHCSCVVTATGTAGWEAIFREKPVLLFGTIFYQYAPGVYRIETVEDCKKAIKEIFEQNKKPEIDKVKIFVKAFEQNTIPVYYDEIYNIVLGGDSPLYKDPEENLDKFFLAFKKRILQSILKNNNINNQSI